MSNFALRCVIFAENQKRMDIKELKINPKNPRKFDKATIDKMVKSITEFPKMLSLRPIVIDDDGTVLGGNLRLKALHAAGFEEIPDDWVRKASELTEEEKKRFIIADNVQFGEWDYDELTSEWDAGQLADWGLELPTISNEVEAHEDDYEIPDEIKTDIVLGDLFEFYSGEKLLHRLLCGDSTDAEQVARLLNGEKADMAHNDPPYGMKKENKGVINDNLNYADLLNFNRKWITLQFTHIKENGSFYCWGMDEPLMDIYSEILKPYIKEQKATFRNLITWDKGYGQGQLSEGYRMYPIADEKCLFVMCGVQGFNNNQDNYFEKWEPIRTYLEGEAKKVGLNNKKLKEICGVGMYGHWFTKSQWELITEEHYLKLQNYYKKEYGAFKKEYGAFKKEYDELKKEYYKTRAYFDNTHDNQNNVWHFDRTTGEERESAGGHATPKPIPLCERAIKTSCPENGLVIDFFLGSGSTMVAAHQLNRKCYGMELDPKYCQVIIDRMLKLDNGLQILKNGNPL